MLLCEFLKQPSLVLACSLQLLVQPGPPLVQEMTLLFENFGPHLGQEAIHRLWSCSPLLSWGQCSLWGRWSSHHRLLGAVFSKVARLSPCCTPAIVWGS